MTPAEAAEELVKVLNDWEAHTGCTITCDGNNQLFILGTGEMAAAWVAPRGGDVWAVRT